MDTPAFEAFVEHHPLRMGPAKGFHVRFANGYVVSVVWGESRYGDGQQTAEVAVFGPDRRMIDDNPDGWSTPEHLAQVMAETAAR